MLHVACYMKCGVCWTKSELFLTKIRTAKFERSAPPPLANARCSAKKFSSHFLIWHAISFSSKRKRKLFCWVLLSTSRAAGLRFGKRAKIPSPQPPSFLPACFRASPDFFADGLQIKRVAGGFRIKIWTPSYIQCSYNDLFS